LQQEGKPGAAAALLMKENFERSLAGIQLGITLVGMVAATTGGATAEESLQPILLQWLGGSSALAEVVSIVLVVFPLTLLTITFGELLPKVFAFRQNEWVCLGLSSYIRAFVYGVWPVVWLFERIVAGMTAWSERLWSHAPVHDKSAARAMLDLRASVALARTWRLIGHQQERIILGAAELSQRQIRDIMLPASAIRMLDVHITPAQALVDAHLDMHTRFPATEVPGDPQFIIGYVNVKDIIAHLRMAPHDPSLRAIVRDILSFPEHTPVSVCLESMMREKTHVALVRDAAHRVIGMVTLEDIIEELVGEIEDEFDRLPAHITRAGAGWIVGGGTTLTRLREATGIALPESQAGPARTLSDWVLARTTGPLHGGEVVESSDLRVVVRKIRRQKVQEAFVQPIAPSNTKFTVADTGP
jgi:putative hemolysin